MARKSWARALSALCAAGAGADCPESWYEFDSSCYGAFEGPATWDEASERCAALGANLSSIHTQAENDHCIFACGNTRPYQQGCWIGGSDRNQRRRNWFWVDGSPWNWDKWFDHGGGNKEPNNDFCTNHRHCTYGHTADCNVLEVSGRVPYRGYWLDTFCTDRQKYICKMTPQDPEAAAIAAYAEEEEVGARRLEAGRREPEAQELEAEYRAMTTTPPPPVDSEAGLRSPDAAESSPDAWTTTTRAPPASSDEGARRGSLEGAGLQRDLPTPPPPQPKTVPTPPPRRPLDDPAAARSVERPSEEAAPPPAPPHAPARAPASLTPPAPVEAPAPVMPPAPVHAPAPVAPPPAPVEPPLPSPPVPPPPLPSPPPPPEEEAPPAAPPSTAEQRSDEADAGSSAGAGGSETASAEAEIDIDDMYQ